MTSKKGSFSKVGKCIQPAEYIEINDAYNGMEYLRASGSMPFVSNLVEINGNKYLDGAIADPIPFKKALDMGFGKIIVIQTRPADYTKTKSWLPFDLVYKKYPNFIKKMIILRSIIPQKP